MNEYELTYAVDGVGGGVTKERIRAGSEHNARNLLRARYGGSEVRIYDGRMTEFGGGRNERDARRDQGR
jgi:hypothetical protein